MKILESVRIAFTALSANKLRSALTMLGIIIGVGAVITLMGIGEGIQVLVTEEIQGVGSNLIFVVPGNPENNQSGPPGARSAPTLTLADSYAIADARNVPSVVAVAPVIATAAQVIYRDEDTTTTIYGITPEYAKVRNFYPAWGEYISQIDIDSKSRVCVIGQTVMENLFDEGEYPIGQMIKVNRVNYRVIGVLEEKGGSGFSDEDDVVLIPLSTAQRFFPQRTLSGEPAVSVIFLQVASEDLMNEAADQVTALLRRRHRLALEDDNDFTVINQADLLAVFQQLTGALTLFLGVIAGISLLVGGIGIMNIMLVSVTERTREIGIRKAVGAKRRDILLQFLVEAVVLSMIGGMLGIGLGFMGAQLIARFNQDLDPRVTASSILLATSFSAAVGLFFGIYPATRAASLNPIDALRYE